MSANRPAEYSRPAPSHAPPPPPAETGEHASWFSPGRTVRVPVGYFWLGAALVLAVFVGGWAIGNQMARRAIAEERARDYLGPGGPSRDPIMETAGGSGFLPGASDARAGESRPNRDSGAAQPRRTGIDARILPDRDPRQEGLNYLALASYDYETAVRCVEFLVSQGVDAYVLHRNNDLFQVMVNRGFPGGSLSEKATQDFIFEMKRLGRIFKNDHRGGIDFEGATFFKYQP
ncbi:MAG: hypothetical protein VYC34_03560 [Planctomycetota bacterium]|nr:hypothetical protein [Planctomycetota bacterium]